VSAIGQLLKLPQYARNLARLRFVLSVMARHGFGHWLVRAGLDKYASPGTRGLALADTDASALEALTWELRVRHCCEELGPTFVKLGQVAATRPDIIPMSLIVELRKLQDDVAPFDFSDVKQIVEADLGKPLAELYSDFTEKPIAAASIGQVHRAMLLDGQAVVVKVQRPGLEASIRTDLDLLSMMARLIEERVPEAAAFRPADAIDQFARGLKRETDFTGELDNIERFRHNFLDEPRLHLPVTYPQLSTKRVLTMEFIDGFKVNNIDKLAEHGISGKDIAQKGTQIIIRSIFEHGFFHADPHPGNFFILPDGRIALIDFGMMGAVDRETIDDLLSFLVALLLSDTEMLVMQFIDLGLVDDTVNVRAMQGEIAEIMARYNGRTLAQLDIGVFIAEVFEAVVRYHVRLPVELILIGKSISTVEGIAQEIYPEFNPLEELRPHLVELYARRMLDPKTHTRKLYRVLHDYGGLLRVLPGEIRGVLRRIKAGDLTLNVRDPGAEARSVRAERSVNRTLISAYGITAWVLFTVTLPQALAATSWRAPMVWYAVLLALQGVVALIMVLLSLARSREL
jgi:ubiquinone biosynthesis protein